MTLLNLQDEMNIFLHCSKSFSEPFHKVCSNGGISSISNISSINVSIRNIILVLLVLLCSSTNSMDVNM